MGYTPEQHGPKERALTDVALSEIARAFVILFEATGPIDDDERRKAIQEALKHLLPVYETLHQLSAWQEMRAVRGPYKKDGDGNETEDE